MNIGLKFREQLVGDLHIVGEELDHLMAALNARFTLNDDGTITINTGSTGAKQTNKFKTIEVTEESQLFGVVKLDAQFEMLSGPWVLDPPGVHRAILKPAKIVGPTTVNNYYTTGLETAIGLSLEPDTGTVTLTGIVYTNRRERLLLLRNRDSAQDIIVKHNSGSSSTGYRFKLPNDTDVTLGPGQGMWLFYDHDHDAWTSLITPNKTGGLTGSGTTGHALLDGSIHTDTVAATVSRGSIPYGNSTPKWDELVIGAANTVLRTDGTDAMWGKVNLSTDVTGTLPNGNGGDPWTYVWKTTDETIQSDNAIGNDSTLVLSVTSGIRYRIKLDVWYTSNAAADFKWSVVGPAVTRFVIEYSDLVEGGTRIDDVINADPGEISHTTTTGDINHIWADVLIEPSSSGTFAFEWAQATSSAVDTTVQRGSYLAWTVY